MLLIIIFSSIVLAGVTDYLLSKELTKGINYFENQFPDFSFDGTTLNVERYEEGYDEEYDIKVIADTSEIGKEQIDEYIKKTKDATTSIIILKDKIIYRNYDIQNDYTYEYINTGFNLNNLNKADVLEEFKSLGGNKSIIATGFVVLFLTLLIENIIEVVTYILLVSIVAIFVGRICGIVIKYPVAIALSIYSLTVPVLCSLIYGVVYNLTGFEIKYFSAMYLMIAYVYIIAAILIIKTDLMKMSKDLMKIKTVDEEIKEELEKKKLEEQENKEDNDETDKENDGKKDDSKNDNKQDEPKPKTENPDVEPDGSEV